MRQKLIGTYDAKKALSALLAEVESGQSEFVITKNERPLAWLIRVPQHARYDPASVIADIRGMQSWGKSPCLS